MCWNDVYSTFRLHVVQKMAIVANVHVCIYVYIYNVCKYVNVYMYACFCTSALLLQSFLLSLSFPLEQFSIAFSFCFGFVCSRSAFESHLNGDIRNLFVRECMHTYVRIHVYMHIYINTCTHIYMYTYIIYILTYITYVYLHMYIYTHIHTCRMKTRTSQLTVWQTNYRVL